jgi:hypothetical protein
MHETTTQDTAANACETIELLLQKQYEALVRDDFSAMEEANKTVMEVICGLSLPQRHRLHDQMENIRAIHERMISTLSAKRELTLVDLAATRQRRKLNKSYGAHDE